MPIRKNTPKKAIVKKPKSAVLSAPSYDEKLSVWFACKPKSEQENFIMNQIDTILSHLSDKGFRYFVKDHISTVTEEDFKRFNKLRRTMIRNFELMEKAIAAKKDCEVFRNRILANVYESDRISKKYE